MRHELKTDPFVFDEVQAGDKTFEIRKDDRGFRVGDTLVLKRTVFTGAEMAEGSPLIYSEGEICVCTVLHILRLFGKYGGNGVSQCLVPESQEVWKCPPRS